METQEKQKDVPILTIKELTESALKQERVNNSMLIRGKTGIGKTAIVSSWAEMTNRILVKWTGQGMEAGDFSLPSINEKTGLVEYHKAHLLNFEQDKKYLLFIDEINRCDHSVQSVLLGLWQTGGQLPQICTHEIDADLWIVSCINDEALQEGMILLNELDGSFKDRNFHYELVANIDESIKYYKNIYSKDNIFLKFLSSHHRKSVINSNFDNCYDSQSQMNCTPRTIELVLRLVEGISIDEIENYYIDIQAGLGLMIVNAFITFVNEFVRLDSAELFKEKPIKIYSDLIKKTDQESTECLLSAIEGVFQILENKTKKQFENLISNIEKLEKNHSELMAVFFNMSMDYRENCEDLASAIENISTLDILVKMYTKKPE